MPDKHNRSPVEILMPRQQSSPCIFISPHSGRYYPRHFLEQVQLNALEIRRSEDSFVEELFSHAPDHGAPLIQAIYPRAYVDLNRSPDELDPRMFYGPLNNSALKLSERVKAGLGTIPKTVGTGLDIYAGQLPAEEAHHRIHDIYIPFHDAVLKQRDQTHSQFGFSLIIDCHSMPQSANGRRGLEDSSADIVLGDRFGTSCAPHISDWIEYKLQELGLNVARNSPYAGGYNTHSYANPEMEFHTIQLEIARQLYMNEETIEKHDGFYKLQDLLSIFIKGLILESRIWAKLNHPETKAAE